MKMFNKTKNIKGGAAKKKDREVIDALGDMPDEFRELNMDTPKPKRKVIKGGALKALKFNF